jgi:hypothetical protein
MVKIYNLCAESRYQYKQDELAPFSVYKFPFCDHNVASIKRVFDFCLDASLFL